MKRADLLKKLIELYEKIFNTAWVGLQVQDFVFVKKPTFWYNGREHYSTVFVDAKYYLPIYPAHLITIDNYVQVKDSVLTVYSPHWVTNPVPPGIKITLSLDKGKEFLPPKDAEVFQFQLVRLPDNFLLRRFSGWENFEDLAKVKKSLTTGNAKLYAIDWGTLPLFRKDVREKILENSFAQYKRMWAEKRPVLWNDLLQSYLIDICKGQIEECPPFLLEELI